MKVLVACEFSGITRDAFIERGHNAISCDLISTEKSGPHYQGDVMDIIDDGFDLMVANPPCTYLANSGVQHLHKIYERWILMQAARDFFMMLFESNIPKICIENPVPHKYAQLPDYHQIIQPTSHGHKMLKRTCLWFKNLPPLMSTKIMDDVVERYVSPKTGRSCGSKWYYYCKMENGKRSKERSRTFEGIAAAMAEQWG
jgi:hypothetical protein